MIRHIKTIDDAAHEWVREFNAIDTDMIAELAQNNPDDWCEVTVFDEDKYYYGTLPMWGTMWSFGDMLDDEWLETHGGIEKMSECGFRIYHSEKHGYFFGIDGAGYNFYGAHWIPLYKARGLRWHDENKEVLANG